MDPLIWAVLLTFGMMVLVTVEVLTPTFGVATITGVVLALGSVVLAFKSSSSAGFVMLGVNLSLMPISFFAAMRILKASPLRMDTEISVQRASASVGKKGTGHSPTYEDLLGRSGIAVTPLRPAGTIEVDGTRIDVVTEGKFVDNKTPIKVIRVDGSIVIVEPVEEPEPVTHNSES